MSPRRTITYGGDEERWLRHLAAIEDARAISLDLAELEEMAQLRENFRDLALEGACRVCGYREHPDNAVSHARAHDIYVDGVRLPVVGQNVIFVRGKGGGRLKTTAVSWLSLAAYLSGGYEEPVPLPKRVSHNSYLFIRNGRAVGFVIAGPCTKWAPLGETIKKRRPRPGIGPIFVAANHRRSGVGRALVEQYAKDVRMPPAALVHRLPFTLEGLNFARKIGGEEMIIGY